VARPKRSVGVGVGVRASDSHALRTSVRATHRTDKESGRVLDKTIEIHTLELGKYNLAEADLATASMRDRWLYWFLHAQEYEPEALLQLFPETAMQLATNTITKIAKKTEDKTMYDAREKAMRDRQLELTQANSKTKHVTEPNAIRDH
jgi:hypothetical protein